MKQFFILTLLVCIGSLFGCHKGIENYPDAFIDRIVLDNPINFESPEPGQQTLFRCFLSTCSKPDEYFTFTDDTLILKVFEEDGQLFFTESVTVHSSIYREGIFVDPVIYKIYDDEGFLIMSEKEGSQLFVSYDSDSIDLGVGGDLYFTYDSCDFVPSNFLLRPITTGPIKEFRMGEILFKDKILIFSSWERRTSLFHDRQKLLMTYMRSREFIRGWLAIN